MCGSAFKKRKKQVGLGMGTSAHHHAWAMPTGAKGRGGCRRLDAFRGHAVYDVAAAGRCTAVASSRGLYVLDAGVPHPDDCPPLTESWEVWKESPASRSRGKGNKPPISAVYHRNGGDWFTSEGMTGAKVARKIIWFRAILA